MSINKNILHTFISQIPVQLLGIFSGVFMTRTLGVEQKGVYAIFLANSQLLSTFFSFSIHDALMYFIPQKKISIEKAMGIAIYLLLGSLLFITILLFVLHSARINFINVFFPENHTGGYYLIWISLFSSISIFNQMIIAILNSQKEFIAVNRLAILSSVINLLLFMLLFYLYNKNIFRANALNVLYASLFVMIINFLPLIFVYIRKIGRKPNLRISIKQDILPLSSFLIYTHMGMFINIIGLRISYWVLNHYKTPIQVGLFSLALNISSFFYLISTSIGSVLMPYMSESTKKKEKILMFYKYSKINVTLVLAVGIIAFFTADFIIPLVYGKDFAGSSVLFKILLTGILMSCQSRIYATVIASENKQSYNLTATIFAVVLNIIFAVILIPSYSTKGAAIASVISYIVFFVISMYYVHTKLKIPFRNYFFINKSDVIKYFKLIKNNG